MQISTRPWSVYLSKTSSVGPWLAVGHEGPCPISFFPVSESSIVPEARQLSGEKSHTSLSRAARRPRICSLQGCTMEPSADTMREVMTAPLRMSGRQEAG